jgi:hypothetical protein
VIRPAVVAGLSVLLAAWSAEGATVYRRAAARPAGALAVLGGPAAKPGPVIGGPAEPKARLPGASGSGAPGESKLRKRHAAAASGRGAPSEPAGRSDRRAEGR